MLALCSYVTLERNNVDSVYRCSLYARGMKQCSRHCLDVFILCSYDTLERSSFDIVQTRLLCVRM